MKLHKRLESWKRERDTNAHGFADIADEIILRIARQLSQRPTMEGGIDWSGVKVIDWGKIPK